MPDSTQTLDSKVFFSIPQVEMGTDEYKRWVEAELIPKWIVEKEGNDIYTCRDTGDWNMAGGIFARFGKDNLYQQCKLYKFDGTEIYYGYDRGLLIRDHYSPRDAEKIKLISDGLEDFLKEQNISYARQDFYCSKRRF